MKITDNKALFEFYGVNCALSYVSGIGWRLQSEYSGIIDDFGAAQMLSADLNEVLEEKLSGIDSDSGNAGVRITAEDENYADISDSQISFYYKNKKYRTVKKLTSGDGYSEISVELSKEERLYGTGERFNRVNQRGKKIHIYSIDRWCWTEGNSYVPVPFILSSECSGLYFNRYEHSVFNLGFSKRNTLTVKQLYAPIDLYIFREETPAGILKDFSDLTGYAPMPADWCFGTQVCRYHPEFSNKEGVYAMIDAMKENDFPWEAVIIEGWGTYKKEKLGDLKEIGSRVHSLGKKMMVYEQCGRFPKNEYKDFGLDDSYAVAGENGAEMDETRSMNWLDNFSGKKMRCIDLTSVRALDKWSEIWDYYVNEIGVDGAKIDFCEQFPDKESVRFSDGRNPMAAHHWYPVLYNIIQYRRFNSKEGGGLNFSRGGGIGAQRYPFIWAGDQRREFFFLKVVIKAALSLGLSGIPFASWDMAGYQPSFNLIDRICEDKVFIRALEFTAFSPNIQTHGRVKRPYDFDEHTKDTYRAYSKLHDCLRPYIKEQAEISCKTGIPLMRHLFLYDSFDRKCLDTEDEYMFGGDLLVAPVLKRRKRRNIYLPDGNWVNIFDGRKYKGGQTIKNFKVPLEMIPVFKREAPESASLDSSLDSAKDYIKTINRLAGVK